MSIRCEWALRDLPAVRCPLAFGHGGPHRSANPLDVWVRPTTWDDEWITDEKRANREVDR